MDFLNTTGGKKKMIEASVESFVGEKKSFQVMASVFLFKHKKHLRDIRTAR